MINKWKQIFGVLAVVVISICCIITIFYDLEDINNDFALRYKNFTLNTPGCQIPYLDPMDPSIAHFFYPLSPLVCQATIVPLIVSGDDSLNPTIKLSENFKKYMSLTKCFYRRIYRSDDYTTAQDEIMHPIENDTNIVDEFIKVECTYKWVRKYIDYFAFIQKKADVEKRCQKAKIDKNPMERLNVILLGIDSTSKSQFLRHMKKTLKYMKRNINFVDLVGYNKLGMNTYPNMVPMLTGHLAQELKDTSDYYVNVLPLIWNDFAKKGYRTQFSEDSPGISMFNFGRHGFDLQPTDYYFRPFALAVANTSTMRAQVRKGCINGRPEADIILNWTRDLLDVFKNESVFSLTHLTRLSHDHINDLTLLDQPYVRFIKSLKDKGHLERSFVFFFGDHGIRYGKMRSTYVGRIEEKLPFMYVFVPPWFPKRYPKLYVNLQANSHRLTTALDVYATLKDILNFSGNSVRTTSGRSISLIGGIISENRTCEDAHIATQYCACTKLQQISPRSAHVVESAQELVNTVNKITRKQRSKCAEIKLDEIKNANVHYVHSGEGREKVSTTYQVTFQVQPGGGVFEGTVWYSNETNTYHPQTDIERINLYDNQSICIDIAVLKPFCYCYNS